jgi:hypothetical protein
MKNGGIRNKIRELVASICFHHSSTFALAKQLEKSLRFLWSLYLSEIRDGSMVPIIIVVGTSAIVTPSIVATTIIAAAVVSATIVTAVISVAPIRSVPITTVSVIRCAVKRTRAVVARPKKDRDRNWQAEDKSNPSARRRFSEERKSRDNQQEDNELLHNWVLDELRTILIKRNGKNADVLVLLFCFVQFRLQPIIARGEMQRPVPP